MSAKLKIVLADLFYVNRLTQSRLCVPLNVAYIAAYAKSLYGDQIDIKIFKDVKLLQDHLRNNKPDIAAFSFYYWNQNLNYHVVKKIRESYGNDPIVVFGGPSVDSIEPEHRKLLKRWPLVDVFTEGEGEAGFGHLVGQALANKKAIFENPIDCSFFEKNGEYLRGPNTSKSLDLSKVPSPYLNGFLDEFLERSYFPLLQATRTCPYQCTFCVAGKDRSKLRAFPLDQVKQEIDYIAHWNKERPHVLLNLAELNFGINAQDPEIARYLKSVSEKTGYPNSVYFYSDKKFTETSRQVIQELGSINKDGLVFSLQSDHPETLKAINRRNLPDTNIAEGITWAKENKIPVTTEVIFGLPYEKYDSMVTLLNKSVNQGFDSIMLHNLFIMEGVELNRDTEVEKHGMLTKSRLLGSNYMKIDDEIVFEFENLVTENKYFTFEDFVKIRCLNLMFFSVFQGSFYKFFFQYVKGRGIPLATFFQEFMNPDPSVQWPEEYLKFVGDFKRDCVEELHENMESLRTSVEKIWNVNNDVGEPVRLNPYYYSRLMYCEKGWVNGVLSKILFRMNPEFATTTANKEVNDLLTLSEHLIIDLRKIEPTAGNFKIDYDLNAWKDDKFHKTIHEFSAEGNELSTNMTKPQSDKLTSFRKANGHLADKEYYFVAVESIFPRSHLFYNLKNTVSTSTQPKQAPAMESSAS